MIYSIGIPLRLLPNRNISITYPRNLDLDPDSDNPILLDSMFGKLAQWLRMIGLNVISLPNFDDKMLIKHGGMIITRDVNLFIRRLRRYNKTMLLYSDNLDDQLILVLSLLRKLPNEMSKPKYCTVCGGRLIKVEVSRLSVEEIPIHVIHKFRY